MNDKILQHEPISNMNLYKKLLITFGTRPCAIKMAPIINALKNEKIFTVKTCVTGQHRKLLDQMINLFDIDVDYDLNIMQPSQTLSEITATILKKMEQIFIEYKPDLVLIQGDTNTSFAIALAAYYHKIDIAHIEAGLRTGNIYSPWPEEGNRCLISKIAKLHFCPTEQNKKALIKENINSTNLFVTGNTVVDALLHIKCRIFTEKNLQEILADRYAFINKTKKLILVTCHRRENFGVPLNNICQALKTIAKREDVEIIIPVHSNPSIFAPIHKLLYNTQNIYLFPPLDYVDFIYIMLQSFFILTDSGGIQEEAISLNKYVGVLRTTTERTEAIETGLVKIIGTNYASIIKEIYRVLDNSIYLTTNEAIMNPYGDGQAANKIVSIIKSLNLNTAMTEA